MQSAFLVALRACPELSEALKAELQLARSPRGRVVRNMSARMRLPRALPAGGTSHAAPRAEALVAKRRASGVPLLCRRHSSSLVDAPYSNRVPYRPECRSRAGQAPRTLLQHVRPFESCWFLRQGSYSSCPFNLRSSRELRLFADGATDAFVLSQAAFRIGDTHPGAGRRWQVTLGRMLQGKNCWFSALRSHPASLDRSGAAFLSRRSLLALRASRPHSAGRVRGVRSHQLASRVGAAKEGMVQCCAVRCRRFSGQLASDDAAALAIVFARPADCNDGADGNNVIMRLVKRGVPSVSGVFAGCVGAVACLPQITQACACVEVQLL